MAPNQPYCLSSFNYHQPNLVYREYREQTLNLLKHRILVFLYKKAVALSEAQGSPYEVRNFFKYFDQVRKVR